MSTGLGIGRAAARCAFPRARFLDGWSTGAKIGLERCRYSDERSHVRTAAKEIAVKSQVQYKLVRLCLAAASIAVFVEALGAGRRW